MVFLALFFILKICSCTEFNKESNQTMATKVVENLHQGIPNILVTLGDALKEQLANPVADARRGQQVIEELLKYYKNLKDVLDMLKSKEDIEKKLGMKLFNSLLASGGPPHIDEDFDMEDAMGKYQWNNRAVYTVRKVLDETDVLWQDIQLEVEKPSKGM